jgi:hypothetical protein
MLGNVLAPLGNLGCDTVDLLFNGIGVCLQLSFRSLLCPSDAGINLCLEVGGSYHYQTAGAFVEHLA